MAEEEHLEAGDCMTERNINPKKFFTDEEKKIIESKISIAEKITSGEIRVHIEKESKKSIFERAREVFEKLRMTNTKDRNGVLIYLALKNKQFTILGDNGIDEKVPSGFWDSTKNEMENLFKQDKFAEGICIGIERAGDKLEEFFPYREGDINELSDEISEG